MATAGPAATPTAGRTLGGPLDAPEAAEPGASLTRARVAAVMRRLRFQRALDGASVAAIAGLCLAAGGVAALKLGEAAVGRPLLLTALLLPALGALWGALRRVTALSAARLLDHSLDDDDLIASAISFAERSESARTPFMRACIDHAERRVVAAEPARALPLRSPTGLLGVGLTGAGVLLLTALEVPVEHPPEVAPVAKPRLLHRDDVAAFREEVAPVLSDAALDPQLRETAEQVNALIEALDDEALDRDEALRELRRLEALLEAELGAKDDEALREALAELGRAIGKSDAAKPLADALREADAEQAKAAAQNLADKLQAGELAAREQRRLEKALARASAEPRSEAEKRALAQAEKQLERLLKKKEKKADAQSPREQRLLRKKRRELDRLRREHAARQEARRQLDRLRRELGGAAGQLGQQGSREGAAQHMRNSAEQLEQAARAQLGKEQRERLRKQLEQLRQLMSKQGKQGRSQQSQSGKPGQQGLQGQQGKLTLERFGEGARGEQGGKPGQQGRPGQQGQPGEQGKMGQLLMPGQGQADATLLMPGASPADGQGQLLVEEAVQSDGAGEGGRPESGKGTKLDGRRVDTKLTGTQGRGPSRSEVIRESTRRGFASRSYREVHGDYQRHAESVLERDEVPGGYRFYVRRYFQLIRPRGTQTDE